MSSLPRPPASCADLDLALVERTLAKHYGDIPAAARELGVSGPDLKRLTWAKPQLLEEADLERMSVIAQVWHVLIAALDSEDWRRKMWASDKIMSSWLARDHPLALARRRSAAADVSVQSKKTVDYTFRWRTSEDDKRDAEAAWRERLRDAGKPMVSIGWGDGGNTIEHEGSPERSNRD
jgi:hypothetical protein